MIPFFEHPIGKPYGKKPRVSLLLISYLANPKDSRRKFSVSYRRFVAAFGLQTINDETRNFSIRNECINLAKLKACTAKACGLAEA